MDRHPKDPIVLKSPIPVRCGVIGTGGITLTPVVYFAVGG